MTNVYLINFQNDNLLNQSRPCKKRLPGEIIKSGKYFLFFKLISYLINCLVLLPVNYKTAEIRNWKQL